MTHPFPIRAFLLFAAASPGCRSTPPPAPFEGHRVVEVRRWELKDGAARVGWLLLLEIDTRDAPLRFYRVLNASGQWAGHATLQGRFSRRVPFRDGEEDMGLFGLAQGARVLLGLSRDPEIVPWSGARAVEADSGRREP
ncbi:MAG: hypothetical protein Fur0037_26100 [Planctomycetota bacterium]